MMSFSYVTILSHKDDALDSKPQHISSPAPRPRIPRICSQAVFVE